MLKRRPLGIAVIVLALAICALGTTGVASAAAAGPEFQSSSYPVAFTLEGESSYIWYQTGEHACKVSGAGSITGPKTAVGRLKFSECSGFELPRECYNGSKVTEMETNELAMTPVYLAHKTRVAVDFHPASGTADVSLKCRSFSPTAEIKGSVLAVVETGLSEKRSLQIRTENSGLLQSPRQYEGENGELINVPGLELGYTGPFSKPNWAVEGWELSTTFRTSRAVNIK
jgi:hypothetical protein